MLSEQPPFGNVLCSDNDRIFHRIGPIGNSDEDLPQMSVPQRSSRMARVTGPLLRMEKFAPLIQAMRSGFPFSGRRRLETKESRLDTLTLDRIMEVFAEDLHDRGVDFQMPSDPLADTPWSLLLQRTSAQPTVSSGV